ncbi:NUDIX domain-containing protein [Corynebacterium sp. A21]|uniref:NUDIX domain-containing protein n=1 Tax=Corynebacterium sp. A21 TaxID=3457318 RepID=UPI003FD435E7
MSNVEHWDITDVSGQPTGDIYLRGAPDWPAGGFHVVSTICVYRPVGEVLLTRRAAHKDMPLTWEFPGGSVLAGESGVEGAVRELWEETGLRVSPEAMVLVGRYVEDSALIDFYAVPFAAVAAPAEVDPDPAEVMAAEWSTLRAVQGRLESGQMAPPWADRLSELWGPLLRVLDESLEY